MVRPMANVGRATLQALFDGVGDPDACAVVDPNTSLTYRAVGERVRKLAGLLRELGVVAGDRVGIQMETSTRTMVSVHAVLYCGAVVVPLDPRAPLGQKASIIADCEIDIVLTDLATKALERQMAGVERCRFVATADVAGARVVPWEAIDVATPSHMVPVRADELAYVIFTSGSTGRPKGIAHSHSSGLSYARMAADLYDVSVNDRVAQAPALHFDQSTFGLYSTPLAGATAVMIPEALLAFPASVAAYASDQRVTIWYSVPTIIMRLVSRGGLDTHPLDQLRWVKFGGEVFPPGQFATAMEALAPARFSNVYGPAEVNQCTYFHLDKPPSGDDQVPIGKAWKDTEIVLVDEQGSVVAPGQEGQIFVRTVTAMKGYWGQPELTQRSFVALPEVDGDGADPNWYATGDLAFERGDGELVFLGRADNQVKVRGHRIEIEAVEAALVDVAGIAGAGVVVDDGDDGASRLVAYVEGPAVPDIATIKRSVGLVLAPAAVPDEIYTVDVLPRTSTGKVDRTALTS